jgi:hypothetical protein
MSSDIESENMSVGQTLNVNVVGVLPGLAVNGVVDVVCVDCASGEGEEIKST